MFKKNFKTQFEENLNRTNFIHNRIKIVEKYFPQLAKALYDYTNKNAKSRDSIDKIATVLNDYGKDEKVTSSFKLQICDFANVLLDIGTEKDNHVQMMEGKVLEQINEYNKLCALVQMELKLSFIASEKEKNWAKHLNRVKEIHPQDLERISIAEAKALKARGESVRASKNLEEHIDIFERRKMNVLKDSLLSWMLTELQFHSKALELFTSAYHIAADIDVNSDIEEFRNKLQLTEDTPESDSGIGSNSILHLISSPFQKKVEFTRSGIPHLCSGFSSPQSSSFNSSFQGD